MKVFRHTLPALLLLAGMGIANTASAALVPKLGGAVVYDTDFDITWLADANLVASNTFGVSISNFGSPGLITWYQAQSWVAAMDAANYLGYSDWRLPTTLQPDNTCGAPFDAGAHGVQSYGYNCTGSELGHLFYQELGATGYAANPSNFGILTGNSTELAKFSNIQSSVYLYYWSGTEYAPDTSSAWVFNTDFGYQNSAIKYNAFYGWAVRSGDVAAAVPEPGSLTLLGVGLAAWVGGRKRRHG